jgi:branched-chain amino acid transport system ATP-binding protein
MEVLKTEKLFKSYGGLKILQDLSFKVKTGERVAIIGPNGAGKTTLINILSGIIPCDSGQIYLFGNEVTALSTYKRVHLGMGRSFQITRLFGNLTVIENILLGLHGTKSSRYHMFRRNTSYREQLVEAQKLLESIDLWDKRNELVQAISYGEQRKLDITLTLSSEAKFLLLDEPTAGLSIAEIPRFIETIKALAKGTTVVFACHDMDTVFNLASRVIMLYYGQIIADGTPEEIRCDSRVQDIYLGSKVKS